MLQMIFLLRIPFSNRRLQASKNSAVFMTIVASCGVGSDSAYLSPRNTATASPTSSLNADFVQEANVYGLPVLQFTLPAELCQSEFGGRHGSNACTLICIFLGPQFKKHQLPSLMASTSLPSQWQKAIANAIVDGNTLHDCTFEGQAVNLQLATKLLRHCT